MCRKIQIPRGDVFRQMNLLFSDWPLSTKSYNNMFIGMFPFLILKWYFSQHSTRHPISSHSHILTSISSAYHNLFIVECPLSIPLRSSFCALVAAADLVVLVVVFVLAREEAYCLPGWSCPPYLFIRALCLWDEERRSSQSPSH
jgi:hypothetical protein